MGARRQHLLSWYQSQFSGGQLTSENVLSNIDEAMLVCNAVFCNLTHPYRYVLFSYLEKNVLLKKIWLRKTCYRELL